MKVFPQHDRPSNSRLDSPICQDLDSGPACDLGERPGLVWRWLGRDRRHSQHNLPTRMSRKPQRSQRWSPLWPLQLVLTVPFVLQVGLAVGITGWLAVRSGQRSVEQLATRLQQEASDRIVREVQDLLNNPSQINALNARDLQTGQLDPTDLEQMIQHFQAQQHIFDGINHISFGSERGDYVAIRRDGNGKGMEILLRQANGDGRLREYFAQELQPTANNKLADIPTLGDRRELKEQKADYDPRQRPWYQDAVSLGKPGWSSIYLYFGESTLGISHTYPVRDANGDLVGVLATDFDLGEIGQFLQTHRVSQTGQAFIIERDGRLVASSLRQDIRVDELQRTTNRNLASQSFHGLIRSTGQYLDREFSNLDAIQSPIQQPIRLDGAPHFLRVTPLGKDYGVDWLLVVVIPQADFMDHVRTNLRMTIGLCLGMLVFSTGVGLLICRWVGRAILRFSQTAEAVATGKVSLSQVTQPETTPPIRELVTLAEAFHRMAQQLQISFAALHATNSELESRVEQRTLELQQANQELQRLATQDALTQLANRRRFDEYLTQEWERAIRQREPISLLLCDVDCFKAYNDTYGHQAGDDCLRHVAKIIRRQGRRTLDLVARYGGEEFAMILPGTDLVGAQAVAQSLHQAVHEAKLPHYNSSVGPIVTLSIGVSYVLPTMQLTPQMLVSAADQALYQAKAQGRDRVVTMPCPDIMWM